MNEKRHEPEDAADALATLVRSAGPRAAPDAERTARARVSVHAAWHESLAVRRRWRWLWISAAALVVLAAGVGMFVLSGREPETPVAVASRVAGNVEIIQTRSAPGQRASLRTDGPIHAGDELETRNGSRLLLAWHSGATIRIDQASRAELESDSALRLFYGTLYVDTDADAGRATTPIAVLTPAGTISHLGTRFEVKVGDDHTRVRVRDGTALFTSARLSPVRIGSGQQLSISGGDTTLEAGPGMADSAWEWTHAISPSFAIEGRSLNDTLEWLAHEVGLDITYATPDVRARAQTVILHGSIDGLALREAVRVVLTGSGFDFELGADTVRIRAAGSG